MSGVLNDCDALLQGADVRFLPLGDAGIRLTPNAPGFHVNGGGVADLPTVTVTAELTGIDGTVSFSISGGTLSNTAARSVDVTYTGGAATLTATVVSDGETFTRSLIIPVLRDGTNGSNGTNPNKTGTAFLFQWATSAPAVPNATSTFTWAGATNTAYAGSDSWYIASALPANPGTPGMKLYVAAVPLSAAYNATTTTVAYTGATVTAYGTNGATGPGGVQSGEAIVYQWAATIPAGPSGSPSFKWSDGSFGAAPTNWALTPGIAPSPGQTLWKARVLIIDTAGVTTTAFNWTSASITAAGMAGATGTPAMWVEVSTSAGQVFSRATSAATFAPTSITLTATPYGGAASAYQWQYWSGSAWANVAGGTTATLAVASGDFTGSRVYRVQATIGGGDYTDEMTMIQVTGGTNGVNAIVGFLTNETAALAAGSDGTLVTGALANGGGTFKVFDGVTDKTGTSIAYSIPTETGCDVTISTAGVYTLVSMAADQATATLQAVYGGVTIQKTLTLVKAKAGASTPGAEGASYVTAYCASATTTTSTAPPATAGRNSVPAVNSGGLTGTYVKTVPTLTAGQFMYQVDGIYNPTNDTVTWSIPYWSSLKVGSLSAISANLGAITGGSLDIGTGATSYHIDTLGNTWAGAATFGGAPFKVSNTGVATFNSVAITGGTLDIGSGATSLHVDSVGNMWAGAATYAAAPFKVSNTGAITATNGTFSGTLSGAIVKVGNLAPTTKGACINDDPALEDMTAWNLAAGLVLVTSNGNAAANQACKNYISAPSYTGAAAQVYETSRAYSIDPAKAYSLTANLYAEPGNNRSMFVYVDFFDGNGTLLTTAWGGARSGYTFGGLTPTGVFTRQGGQFGAGVSARPIPASARTARVGVWFQYTGDGAGTFVHSAQDLRLERIADASMIAPGAVNSTSLATSFTVSIPGGYMSSSGTANVERKVGSRSASVSGPYKGNLTYTWAVNSSESANGQPYSFNIFVQGSSVDVYAKGGNDIVSGMVSCTVTDEAGISKVAVFYVDATFGTGAA